MSSSHSHASSTEPHPRHHSESHGGRVVAVAPGLSLLRLSALERLAGAAVLAVLLWAATWAVLG